MRSWVRNPRGRILVRWLPWILVFAGWFLVSLLGFLVTGSDFDGEHPLNPYWVIFDEMHHASSATYAAGETVAGFVALLGGLFGLGISLPRVVRGLQEPRRVRLRDSTSRRRPAASEKGGRERSIRRGPPPGTDTRTSPPHGR